MPTYAYACTACDHRFEAKQSFSDSALSECPECSGQVRKLFNTVGIVFKGSGFYRNDSRKPESTSSENGSSEKGSSENGSSEKGSADRSTSDKATPDKGGSEKSTPALKKEPASTGASKAAGSAA